ncbi:MAG: SusE domain-containing protein [Bacteroidota bacterium]|nr:SusE domain-containing protein [Ferruginibacter sp.]
MKNIIKLFFGSIILAGTLLSCEKDENKVFLEDAAAPVLSSDKAGTIPLAFVNQGEKGITFNWTNPEYKFTTGANSQDVTYLFEMDTTGANFTNPKKKQLSIANELSRTFTQAEINDFLLNQLELTAGKPHSVEFRVRASVAGSGITERVSNVLIYNVTPYAIPPKVNPPASGALYVTGNAVPSDWTNSPPTTQKFKVVTPTLYELTVPLVAGNSYLFLPDFGSWDAKFGFTGANNANNVDGDDFKFGGGDIKAPATSGNYKIQVNFQTGKFSVTKQ